MARYGVTANAIAPVARTRLTIDATPQTAATMPNPKGGEVDRFSPAHVAPLVAWLGSDDAKDVHGEVFRVGLGNVWLMKGWHSAAKVTQSGPLKFWHPAELGTHIKEQLARGMTSKEGLAEVLTGKV